MKTVKGLLDHCKSASSWKYVYGAKGQVLTRSQIQKLMSMYKSLVPASDLSKAGRICCDCSGLISSYTGVIRSSSNFKSTAVACATISQLKSNWNAYVGWGIWLPGHIGVVSDTPGYYYAMDGSRRNWVHYPISKNSWVNVIKLRDIDYSANTSIKPASTTTVSSSDVNVSYKAYSKKWLSEVVNCNDYSSSGYAGISNVPISGLMVHSSKGQVKLRVSTINRNYLPFVTGYNQNDNNAGYAGILNKSIDRVQMEINGLPGYDIYYRVSLVNKSGYLPWVKNWNDTENGYAGIRGCAIDQIQIKVVKR